ncbi:MAG: hypothetical protein R3F43_04560 [bacterium]
MADLQHDLGKYLRLPLAWLPADADDAGVHAAARELARHPPGGGQTHAAADIWRAFLADVQGTWTTAPRGLPGRHGRPRAGLGRAPRRPSIAPP